MDSVLSDIALTNNQPQWLKHFQAADEQNLSLSDYTKQHNIDFNSIIMALAMTAFYHWTMGSIVREILYP